MKIILIVALAAAVQAEPEADGSWIRPGYYARPYGLIHAPLVKPSLVATRGSHLRYYGYPYRVLGKREAEGEAEAEATAEATPEAEASPAISAYLTPAGPIRAAYGHYVATKRGFRNTYLEGYSEDDNGDGFVDPVVQVGAPLAHPVYYHPYRRFWKREAEATAEATPEAEAVPAKTVFGPVHAAVGPFVATRRGFRNINLEGFSEDVNGDGFVDAIAQVGAPIAPVVYRGYHPYRYRLWKRDAEAEPEAEANYYVQYPGVLGHPGTLGINPWAYYGRPTGYYGVWW